MKVLSRGRYVGRDNIWAVFDLGAAELRVGLLEANLGRVVLRRPGGYRLDRGWSIAPGGMEPPYQGRSRDDLSGFTCPDAQVVEKEGTVIFEIASGLSAEITLEPFGIAWRRRKDTRPFLQDRGTQAYFISNKTQDFQHFMAREPDERHYGLGDKGGPIDHTGRRFRIDAVDPCGYDAELSDPLYKMIPFLIVGGPRGAHGIFYDNLAVAEIDLGCTLDNYHGLFRSYAAEDGDLDYYVLAGPDIPAVVRSFSWLTGGQAFAPKWSLGFATTSMAIADAPDADARISDFIAKCREHGIPSDSFHFGSGYTSIGARRYAFNWNYSKFPDPSATMARLKAAGMQPVTNLKPSLLDDHPRLNEARSANILVRDGVTGEPAAAQFWDGMGYHLDFTNPAGRAWWRKGIETALLDHGVVAVWNDNNEYEIWDEDAVCHGDGKPFPQSLARPAQPLLMTKLSRQTQIERAPGKRPYALTRGGAAGIWRYGQTWSGDNETAWKTLRYNLTQGLTMSLSGMFNIGHDVGGFHGPSPGPELFCRFVEFCSLWPRFVMNSWNDNDVVNLPWMHPEVLPQVREAIQFRYRLMPYLYTAMWKAARDHDPVVRPLLYDFPHDPAAIAVDDCFMLGADLLVAPVLEEGDRARSVYLPVHPGGWYDLRTGHHFEGGKVVRVDAPFGRLPVWARSGAMIPVSEQLDGIDPARDDKRTLLVFGAPLEVSTADLYEDDGETVEWRSDMLHIGFEFRRLGNAFTVVANGRGRYRPGYDQILVRRVGEGPHFQVRTGTGPVRLAIEVS